ncbi:SGNH_hydro domain-containing protein [Nitrospira tepida]|uniref:SGNH_hydro domain-containing protein n=1 Tax=Nitrospira tepida TaxID=2973512 RepID=A0AA86K9X3_9BACT|nr:SGNH_hydro domain-containing protein [Nitrospira tepida]
MRGREKQGQLLSPFDSPGVRGSGCVRRAWLALLTVALSTGMALGASEFAVRLLAPQPTKVTVPVIMDEELIYRLPAGTRGTDVKDEFAVSIGTNAHGLRDRDYAPTKPPGILERLLVIGDSMTFAEGVEAEQTYPKVLERALDGRYEVINAAIRGYGTDQEMIWLERLVPLYRPDAVVLAFFAVNDVDDVLYAGLFEVVDGRLVRRRVSAETSPKYKYYEQQSFIQTFPGYRFLIEHSHLVNWARQRWARREYDRLFPSSGAVDAEHEERAWAVISRLLGSWDEWMRREGIRPLILLIPSWAQVHQGGDALVDARTERVLQWGRERSVSVLDPRLALRTAWERGVQTYYPRDRHMTAQGHAVVAAYLKSGLESLGIVH